VGYIRRSKFKFSRKVFFCSTIGYIGNRRYKIVNSAVASLKERGEG